jgi:hypothetical protein
MSSGVVVKPHATAGDPDSSHNVRTALEADGTATALIDNLHCVQGKLLQPRCCPYSPRRRMC